jgi:septal ring factor EnvC (AmiA/AmiB activator)
MNADALPYLAIAISIVINVATVAASVAKMNARLDFNDERIKELKVNLENHVSNTRMHRDTQAFTVQLEHIEKEMNSIKTEMRQTRESLTQRIDELHKSLIDGQ